MNTTGHLFNMEKDITNGLSEVIAVYSIVEKKLVLLFANMTAAGVYVKNVHKHQAHAALSGNIHFRHKCLKNYFKTPLAIRKANAEQINILGKEVYLCLDDNFKRNDLKCKMVSEFNKG